MEVDVRQHPKMVVTFSSFLSITFDKLEECMVVHGLPYVKSGPVQVLHFSLFVFCVIYNNFYLCIFADSGKLTLGNNTDSSYIANVFIDKNFNYFPLYMKLNGFLFLGEECYILIPLHCILRHMFLFQNHPT